MALDVLLTHTRDLESLYSRSSTTRVAKEVRNYTLGPMPVQDFINNFLNAPDPPSYKNMRSIRRAFQSVPAHAMSSAEIVEPMVRLPLLLNSRHSLTSGASQIAALNECTKRKARCPGFTFATPTSLSRHRDKRGHRMKPDIWCYATDNVARMEAAGASARAEFGYAELFFEVKPDPSHDFFVDPPHDEDAEYTPSFFASSEDARAEARRSRAWGRHVMYVTEVLARQHRLFFFSISMSGSCARFLRWDRAGCIVSASFDIRQEPALLCEFLWRFSQTSSTKRGHDPTVAIATEEEEALFRDAIREYLSLQLDIKGTELLDQALTEHYQPGHVAAMHVYPHDDQHGPGRRFIVSRPVLSPLFLTGRGTRGYWALDAQTCRVVFLKDTWRRSPQREGQFIQQLHESGVRNIPSLVCHGDVPQLASDGPEGNARESVDRTMLSSLTCLQNVMCNVL